MPVFFSSGILFLTLTRVHRMVLTGLNTGLILRTLFETDRQVDSIFGVYVGEPVNL